MVRRCYAMIAVSLAFGITVAISSASSAPPGATARCNDGTYSYSQHRQGTCSHHGGVAAWLSGSSTTTTKSSSTSGGTVDVGTTVLLKKRTKTSGCKLGPNPDRRCSPGAYYSKLTKAVICSSSFRTSSIRTSHSLRSTPSKQSTGWQRSSTVARWRSTTSSRLSLAARTT